MNSDAFSNRHPLVNFLFFVGAVGFGVTLMHPAYIAAAAVCALTYHLLLHGAKGLRLPLALLPMLLFMAVLNPLLNTDGGTVLFRIFARPYTLEALVYGAAAGAAVAVMMLWFACYNAVMTGDKFAALFGSRIPSLSLLLTMVLRLIPGMQRRIRQITGARRGIGKGTAADAPAKAKLHEGMTVLSTLTDWVLESGVATGDSMRARGYGSAQRSSFHLCRMTVRDRLLLAVLAVLAAVTLAGALTGGAKAVYTPAPAFAPLTGFHAASFAAYCAYLLIPVVLHCKEAVQWHISRSGI